MINLKFIFKNKNAKSLFILSILNFVLIAFMLTISSSSNSLALTAFTYLLVFDLLSLLTGILSIWVKYQVKTKSYPYGFKRCEVLAIFSTAILTILGAFFVIKECVESLFEESKQVHCGRLLIAGLVGFFFHMVLALAVRNDSFDYVINSSSSSWLQEHLFDISESTCRYVPYLSKVLLPRVNPIVLIGFAHFSTLVVTYFLTQMGSSYLIDTYSAIFMAVMTIGTMLPFGVYTGNILLQTTPSHLITQLDKVLREASVLDGVLEFREEHFWTLSLGHLAGSLQVRIRRDADEQLVLAHVWNKLAGIVHILTIHIFKDDWMRQRTHHLTQQLVYDQKSFPLPPAAVSSTGIPAFPQQTIRNATSNNKSGLQTSISTSNLSATNSSNSSPLPQFSQAHLIQKAGSSTNVSENDYVIVNP